MHLKALKLDKTVTLKIMNAEKLRYKDGFFDQVISVNFMHHARHPARCLKEMVRVTKNRLVLADINKRGERIMEKVHGLDGHSHAPSRMSLKEMEALLTKVADAKVSVYKDACQTVLIVKKGALQ
jgi:ubiquinone/menaquinone biosynthesis C-methylase UbiE